MLSHGSLALEKASIIFDPHGEELRFLPKCDIDMAPWNLSAPNQSSEVRTQPEHLAKAPPESRLTDYYCENRGGRGKHLSKGSTQNGKSKINSRAGDTAPWQSTSLRV